MAKVKRMMFGGAAKAAPMKMQGMGQIAKPPMQNAVGKAASAASALRKLPMNPPMPGKAGPKPLQNAGRAVAGAARGAMKKGGAVKKKATKK